MLSLRLCLLDMKYDIDFVQFTVYLVVKHSNSDTIYILIYLDVWKRVESKHCVCVCGKAEDT